MKLQKVKGVCKGSKRVYIYNKLNEEGELSAQYISNGYAIYEIYAGITLTADSICAMWDISDKEREKWSIHTGELPEYINCDWGVSGTKEVEELHPRILVGGYEFWAFKTSKGVVFIDAENLKPIADEMERLAFFERVTPDGRPYIVLMRGFGFVAAVVPIEAAIADEIKSKLVQLATEIKGGTR